MSTEWPFNLAAIQEAIAEVIPDEECIVFRDRRLTWREVTDRTRRLANVLAGAGLGARAQGRAGLAGHESHEDHLAIYLYNGNEYLEGMLAAFKLRAVPVNVNYRYVEDELRYLFTDADLKAVVHEPEFASTLDLIRAEVPRQIHIPPEHSATGAMHQEKRRARTLSLNFYQ